MDKNGFCTQIRKCEKAMYALAYSIVGNESDSEDILSEAICRAYQNLNTLENERAFQSWILRIVHNTAVETIRKNARIIPMEDLPETADDAGEALTTKLALREAVERLKQPYRTVVILFYYENLSVASIAKITGVRTAAVRQQLSRARGMLRDRLKEDFDA